MNLLATDARAQLLAAVSTLPDEDALALAALVALGPIAQLRADLDAARDIEAPGSPRSYTATPRDLFIKGEALGLLKKLAGLR